MPERNIQSAEHYSELKAQRLSSGRDTIGRRLNSSLSRLYNIEPSPIRNFAAKPIVIIPKLSADLVYIFRRNVNLSQARQSQTNELRVLIYCPFNNVDYLVEVTIILVDRAFDRSASREDTDFFFNLYYSYLDLNLGCFLLRTVYILRDFTKAMFVTTRVLEVRQTILQYNEINRTKLYYVASILLEWSGCRTAPGSFIERIFASLQPPLLDIRNLQRFQLYIISENKLLQRA